MDSGCGPVFKYLLEKHEELETINIGFYGRRSIKDESEIVQTVFSNLNKRSITISHLKSTGDVFRFLPSTLPNLKKLALTSWLKLSYQELIEILIRSRSNLRELELSDTIITGVKEEKGVNSLPNLENLSGCPHLTVRGLLDILRLTGIRWKTVWL